MRKQDVPKVDGFGPFLGLIYPWKTQNIGKKTTFSQKLHPYEYKIIQVPRPSWGGGGSKNGLFKVKNRLVIKNQEVKGQVSATFSEAPNSGLTVSENIFVVARLKLVLFQF